MRASRRLLPLLAALVLLFAASGAAAEDALMVYTETAAFVNWINIAPDVELSPENTPKTFTAVVRNAGKLRGYGLPVHIADQVTVTLVAPYTWRVQKGEDSVDINTHNKIHFSNYPKFQ